MFAEQTIEYPNYRSHLTESFTNMFISGQFTDVILICENRKVRAHKIILSACSPYFDNILRNHCNNDGPVPVSNIKYEDLLNIIIYIYQGKNMIQRKCLDSFMQTAKLLSIQISPDNIIECNENENDTNSPITGNFNM